jgi:hypothetical protein
MVEDEEDREDREASAEKNRHVMSARCGSGTELRADEPGALQKKGASAAPSSEMDGRIYASDGVVAQRQSQRLVTPAVLNSFDKHRNL